MAKVTKKQIAEYQRNFEAWVELIEERLESWLKSLPKEIAKKLDYSPESLGVAEKYLIETETEESIRKPEKVKTLSCFASYFGEVFRRNIPNSHWQIDLESPRDADFNQPTIHLPNTLPFNPYIVCARALYMQSGILVKDIYDRRS